jgi:hypothetical protein
MLCFLFTGTSIRGFARLELQFSIKMVSAKQKKYGTRQATDNVDSMVYHWQSKG